MAYRRFLFIGGSLFSVFVLVNSWFPVSVRADGGIPKVKAEKQRTELRVKTGEQVRLPCPVEWTPSLLLEWFKDGVAVERALDNARPQRKSLLIVNVTRDNRGVYVCRAVNGFGSAEVSIRLDVIRQAGDDGSSDDDDESSPSRSDDDDDAGTQSGRKPEFVELYGPLHNKNFTQSPEMSSVRFRCAVRGQPRPDVRWLKDGRLLGSADRDSVPTLIRPKGIGGNGFGGDTLFLKNLQQHHTGNYTCVASNEYGTINATFVLDVVSRTPRKPVLTDGHPLNTSVELGGTASFQCRVKSDALPHIQWLKKVDDDHQHHHDHHQQPIVGQQQQQQQQHRHNNGTIVFEGSRFKVLKSSEVVERNEGLYLNKLLLADVQGSDSGTYVCMAANTMGYSFKSAHLSVTSNHGGPWQVMSHDVYDGSSVYHHGVSMTKFPATLIIVVPLTVIVLMLLVFFVLQCRKHSSPVNGIEKTAAGATTRPGGGGGVTAMTRSSQPAVHPNHPQKTAAPLLGAESSHQQWVDSLPSQTLLNGGGGGQNNPMTWHAAHHVLPPNNASRKSGTPPSGSIRDSCSATSGTASLPKVHHHHHYRQHHHQHVYYDQDGWQNPFQC